MTTLLVALASAWLAAAPADALLAGPDGQPGGLEPLHHVRTEQGPERIVLGLQAADGARVVLTLLRPDPTREVSVRLPRYDILVAVEPLEAAEALRPAIDRVIARVRANAEAGPALRSERPPEAAEGTGPGAGHASSAQGATRGPSEAGAGGGEGAAAPLSVELWLCLGLLALLLLTLPWLYRHALHVTGQPRLTLAAWALVALVQLLLIPQRLVMVFAGYGIVGEMWAMQPIAKYGAATTALYGPLLQWLGPDAGVLTATNVVLGLATLPLVAAVTRRLSGREHAGWLALLLVGLMPAMLRDRASESLLVPMHLFLLAALVHLDALLDDAPGRVAHLVGLLAAAALALHARPEAWVALPLLAAAMLVIDGRFRPRLRTLALAAAGVALVALPRLLSLLAYTEVAGASGDVPGLSDTSAAGLWARFLTLNALWDPSVHLLTVTLLAPLALLVAGRGRRLATGLVIVAIVAWQALSTLDLPPVSVPRVQAPALAWTGMLAAATLAWGLAQTQLPRRLAAGALALWCLTPWPPAVQALWQPTNAQAFDAFWARAIERVEPTDTTRCVVALAMSDPPRDIVIRAYPLYEVAARSGRLESLSLQTFLEAPEVVLESGCEALYIEGPQCTARFFGFDGTPPAEARRLPLCERMHRELKLETLAVEDAPNRGNPDFPFWGRSESLRLGLYRITGLARSPAGQAAPEPTPR